MPMLTEVGTYDVAVNVDGKTFQRSQRQTVAVRENFVVKVNTTETLPPAHTVVLFAQNPEIDVPETKVTAHIKSADGKVADQIITATGEREWQLPIPPAQDGGRVEVSFEVAGHYRSGDEFAATTQVVAVDDTGGQVVAGESAKPKAEAAKAAPAEPAAKEESAKEEPKADPKPEPKAEEPAAAEAEPEQPAWKKYLLYGGLVVGNLLVIGLGYLAFRMVMGGSKSKVLDEGEEDGDGKDEKAAGGKAKGDEKKPAAKSKKSLDDLDLPDDAIDIDPAADKKKK
jgi:hypothetical protein